MGSKILELLKMFKEGAGEQAVRMGSEALSRAVAEGSIALPQTDASVSPDKSSPSAPAKPPKPKQTIVARSVVIEPKNTPAYLWDNDAAAAVVIMARQTLAKFPQHAFVSIGNSPSYIGFAMECLGGAAQGAGSVTYVPYSGRHMEAKGKPKTAGSVFKPTIDVSLPPFAARILPYRARLDAMGLNPRAIVSRHQNEGVKTAFMDVASSGESAMSFVHLMLWWAKELGLAGAYSRATDVVLFSPFDFVPSLTINDKKGLGRTSVGISLVPIGETLRVVLNSNLSFDNDRFVPAYYMEEWDREPAALRTETLAIADQIKTLIRQKAEGQMTEAFQVPSSASGGMNERDILRKRADDEMIRLQTDVLAYYEQCAAEACAPNQKAAAPKPRADKDKKNHKNPVAEKSCPSPADKAQPLPEPKPKPQEEPKPPEQPQPEQPKQPEQSLPVAVAEPQPDEAEAERKARRKVARYAAREILFAFWDVSCALSRRHKDILVMVEGLTPAGLPQRVEDVAWKARTTPAEIFTRLEEVAAFMTRRVAERAFVDVPPDTMAEALRVFSTSRRTDRTLTEAWLDLFTDEKAAAAKRVTPDDVRAARMRIVKKMSTVLLDDMTPRPSP